MRVALITALPPIGGAGAARVQSPRPAQTRRSAKRSLTVRVAPAEVDANFAFAPDPARGLPYSPPILKGRILR